MDYKKNILIISTFYPPIQSVATNRIFSFAKYLSEDYNVHVLTIDNKQLLSEEFFLPDVNVYRVNNKRFFKKASFEKKTNSLWHKIKTFYNLILNKVVWDEYSVWTKNATALGRRIVKEENINIIITSFAPLASHLVGLNLKKEFVNIKWIADMRDEFFFDLFFSLDSSGKLKRVVDTILSNTDAITTVSQPILDQFKKIVGNRKCITNIISNGYDFDLQNDIIPRNEIFTIIYTGSFYGDINPNNFFKAIIDIIEVHNVSINIKLIGVTKPIKVPNLLKDYVTFIPKVPYMQILDWLKQADLLLLIIPSNSRTGVFTGKIFDYLGSRRPILALVPKNDVADLLIRKANAGYIAENENIDEIKEKFLEAYNDWKDKKPFNPDLDIIRKLHRKEQVEILETLIGELLHE